MNILRRLWPACRQAGNLFSSTTLAVILVMTLAVVSVLGTVIPQNENPEIYFRLYGEVFTRFFYSLGLIDLYGSFFFKIILTLLGISLLTCSAKRMILAVQGKLNWYMWGAFLSHLSILIIYLGVIYGGAAGFSLDATIEKGSSYFEPQGNFYVKLNDFNAKFDEKGRPLVFSSDLSVIEKGKEILRKTIFVNKPLTYQGIKFYQSYYGLNGILEIKGPGGKMENIPIYKGSCAVYSTTNQMFHVEELYPNLHFLHGMALDEYEPTKAVAFIIAHDDKTSEEIGWLMQGKSVRWKNYYLKLAQVKEYTGLQIKKDPGVPVVYLGFVLLTVGIGMMLYKLW